MSYTEDKDFENNTNEESEEESQYREFDIITEVKTPNIKSLQLDWEDGTLQIPQYQRRFVWTIKQASLFIESLMLDLPIATLMFLVDSNGNNLIIDGQQRIKSILYFIGAIKPEEVSEKEQKFINFKLQNLPDNSYWKNKCFSEFKEFERKKLKDKSLQVIYITLKDPNDLSAIFYIFERLNKNGTMLTAQEIRNCIYSGSFNDFLLELNKYPNWRKIFTNNADESRQRDVELILRFFALYDNLNYYKKPMKDFLSDYMSKPEIRNMDTIQMNQKKKIFEQTVDAIVTNLGSRPFHIKRGLNSAVADSVMLAFANNIDSIPNNISTKYLELCKNDEFYTYCDKSVNDVNSVKNRIQIANDFLFNKISSIDLKPIRLYELPASAGLGNFISDDNIQYTIIHTTNRKADFALKISGDSMEPDIPNESIVLVKNQNTINSGQIGIFIYDDEVRCKRFLKKKKQISLISLNKKYSPIVISSNRKLDVLGLVVGVLDEF